MTLISNGDVLLTFASRISAVDYIWFLLKEYCHWNMHVNYVTIKSIMLLSIPFHAKFTFFFPPFLLKGYNVFIFLGYSQHFLKRVFYLLRSSNQDRSTQ